VGWECVGGGLTSATHNFFEAIDFLNYFWYRYFMLITLVGSVFFALLGYVIVDQWQRREDHLRRSKTEALRRLLNDPRVQ